MWGMDTMGGWSSKVCAIIGFIWIYHSFCCSSIGIAVWTKSGHGVTEFQKGVFSTAERAIESGPVSFQARVPR